MPARAGVVAFSRVSELTKPMFCAQGNAEVHVLEHCARQVRGSDHVLDVQSNYVLEVVIYGNTERWTRWHVTDDQGFHCPRDKLDDATGCCKDGVRHSCKT
jgi:hypothetical protein